MVSVAAAALTALALPALLVGEVRGPTWLKVGAKPLASLGFLVLGGSASMGHPLQLPLMAALGLCAVGDVCLLSQARGPFLAGLVSFLLGHLAYCGVFALHGLSVVAGVGALVVLLPVAAGVARWLWPHVPPGMRGPVAAYIAIITAMTAAAAAAALPAARPEWLVGAVLFFVSDLFVARNRFVGRQPINRLVGLPLYYVAQLVLAASLASGSGPAGP